MCGWPAGIADKAKTSAITQGNCEKSAGEPIPRLNLAGGYDGEVVAAQVDTLNTPIYYRSRSREVSSAGSTVSVRESLELF
jgi:hypothetical protein